MAVGITLGWLLGMGGCSTTQIDPLPAMPVEPPAYVKVPHPAGLDRGDLMAIFLSEGAPDSAALEGCDADFLTLKTKTESKSEISTGLRELIRREPVKWHWCFYYRLLTLDAEVKDALYFDERKKQVLDRFEMLTPVARAFQFVFGDSRYLRWAVARYRSLSETVFYRRLELSPQGALKLSGPIDPFGAFRPVPEKSSNESVLTKYGIIAAQPDPESSPQPQVEVTPGLSDLDDRFPATDGTPAVIESLDQSWDEPASP